MTETFFYCHKELECRYSGSLGSTYGVGSRYPAISEMMHFLRSVYKWNLLVFVTNIFTLDVTRVTGSTYVIFIMVFTLILKKIDYCYKCILCFISLPFSLMQNKILFVCLRIRYQMSLLILSKFMLIN